MDSHRRVGTEGNNPEIIPVVYETDSFFIHQDGHNGRAVYRYANGNTYSGMMSNSKPNGYGALLTDRWVYTGTWNHGKLERGTMVNIGSGLTVTLPLIEIN